MKQKAFTIVELVVVVTIIALIVPMIFNIYTDIQKEKNDIALKQQMLLQGYDTFEKIAILSQNYTIDYEEYFNRSMVGCKNTVTQPENFTREVSSSGYCTQFTHYGNANPLGGIRTGDHRLYYKSSTKYGGDPNPLLLQNERYKAGYQSYGQYEKLFYDMKTDVDNNGTIVGDADDEDLGSGMDALWDPNHIQELYLISLDGKKRLYFRRVLVRQGHLTGELHDNSREYGTGESLYTLQMLRLKGFDAGTKHNFSMIENNTGLYDGVVDTWACDASQGFMGHGASVSGAYAEYRLPNSVDDCWVDVYQSTISVDAWKIHISPIGDPELFWKQQNYWIHPYFSIAITYGVYLPEWTHLTTLNPTAFSFTLQSSFNIKDIYV